SLPADLPGCIGRGGPEVLVGEESQHLQPVHRLLALIGYDPVELQRPAAVDRSAVPSHDCEVRVPLLQHLAAGQCVRGRRGGPPRDQPPARGAGWAGGGGGPGGLEPPAGGRPRRSTAGTRRTAPGADGHSTAARTGSRAPSPSPSPSPPCPNIEFSCRPCR